MTCECPQRYYGKIKKKKRDKRDKAGEPMKKIINNTYRLYKKYK